MPPKKSVSSKTNGSREQSDSDEKGCKVTLDEEKIRKTAFSISQRNFNYDVLCWMCGEMDVRLKDAIVSKTNPLISEKLHDAKINPARIIVSPKKEMIEPIAQDWANRKLPLQDLHWALAIRNNIFDQIQ